MDAGTILSSGDDQGNQRLKESLDQLARLREAIDRALELPSKIGTMRLMHNQHGQKYRYDALNSAWERAMAKAVAADDIEPFRFHDLERKGVTDAEGDKLAASGH